MTLEPGAALGADDGKGLMVFGHALKQRQCHGAGAVGHDHG